MAPSVRKNPEAAPDIRREETAVVVVFFDDMKGSLVLKDHLAALQTSRPSRR